MTTSISRVCLFGGALFAAGIATQNAHAQGFAHDGGVGFMRADRIVGTDPYFVFQPTSLFGFGTNAYASGGFFGSVTMSTDEISIIHNRADSSVFSYSRVTQRAYVSAVSDITAQLAWDFGAWDTAYINVFNLSTLEIVFDTDAVNAGTATLQLVEGTAYRVRMDTSAGAAGGDSFARITIAEPCVADLDGNGVLNFDDIDAFVNGFLGGCP